MLVLSQIQEFSSGWWETNDINIQTWSLLASLEVRDVARLVTVLVLLSSVAEYVMTSYTHSISTPSVIFRSNSSQSISQPLKFCEVLSSEYISYEVSCRVDTCTYLPVGKQHVFVFSYCDVALAELDSQISLVEYVSDCDICFPSFPSPAIAQAPWIDHVSAVIVTL